MTGSLRPALYPTPGYERRRPDRSRPRHPIAAAAGTLPAAAATEQLFALIARGYATRLPVVRIDPLLVFRDSIAPRRP
ncbi:MAG TPA: hypothetical protein VHE61_05210 [Opitutaceae bacterium]|nr:hypothetical protein [Opitutaceae bacterium]